MGACGDDVYPALPDHRDVSPDSKSSANNTMSTPPINWMENDPASVLVCEIAVCDPVDVGEKVKKYWQFETGGTPPAQFCDVPKGEPIPPPVKLVKGRSGS